MDFDQWFEAKQFYNAMHCGKSDAAKYIRVVFGMGEGLDAIKESDRILSLKKDLTYKHQVILSYAFLLQDSERIYPEILALQLNELDARYLKQFPVRANQILLQLISYLLAENLQVTSFLTNKSQEIAQMISADCIGGAV